MTPEELKTLGRKIACFLLNNDSTFRAKGEELAVRIIEPAIREAEAATRARWEPLVEHASGVLADIAFAGDLTEEGRRNKAKHHHQKINEALLALNLETAPPPISDPVARQGDRVLDNDGTEVELT